MSSSASHPLAPYVLAAIELLIVLVAAYAAAYLLVRLLRRAGGTPPLVRGVRGAVTIAAILAGLAIVANLVGGVGLTSGLTLSAIGGLAITLALQTSLGNIIAGFLLLQDGMLKLKDDVWVSSQRGKVVKLGLISVWLELPDGTLVTVSNSTLLSGPTVNYSAKERLKGEY